MIGSVLEVLETLRLDLTSLGATLAYIALAYATIGQAMSARNRYEDMVISFERNKIESAKKARDQAEKDFHNWYGSLLFITSGAEIIGIFIWIAFLLYFKSWSGLLNISLPSLVLIIVHAFVVTTYKVETDSIFNRKARYRWFLPWQFLKAQIPDADSKK